MNIDELLAMTPSELEHSGVKGQKWGVRRRTAAGIRAVKGEVKLRGQSVARENSWAKKDISKMSTKELQRNANRARLENELKRHARGTGRREVKRDYLNRKDLTTEDLQSKVRRLNLEREFNKQASQATRSQIKMAQDIMKSMASDPTPTGVATGVLAGQLSDYTREQKKYNN